MTVATRDAPSTNRTHILSATCIGVLSKGEKAFALLTNAPENIDQFKNGDILNVTAPLCSDTTRRKSRISILIKQTGASRTSLGKPRFQHIIVGATLFQYDEPQYPQFSKPPQIVRDCESCPEMVHIPGGTFSMGSDDDSTEQPIHKVTTPPFVLARFPVTVSQWRQCAAANACSDEPSRDGGEGDMPVHNVSWDDAQQYVAWLSKVAQKQYRLPTEAEWEHAARANSSTKYWWGARLADDKANCRECGDPYDDRFPVRVGSFAPNQFGLYDMAGGVAQWVADCWRENYEGASADGSSWDAPDCRERVSRGGSWKDAASNLRAASRGHHDAGTRDPAHGVRIARSP